MLLIIMATKKHLLPQYTRKMANTVVVGGFAYLFILLITFIVLLTTLIVLLVTFICFTCFVSNFLKLQIVRGL